MVIWIDAHIAPALATWMRRTFGVDAAAIRSLGLRDANDPAIFAAARAAGAILISKDSDFVDLVARRGPPPQLVWLTCGNTDTATLRAILNEAWPRVAELLRAGEPLVEISGRFG